MTDIECRQINREILASWAQRLTNSHATPFAILGVGSDQVSGIPFVITLESVTTFELVTFLRGVANDLEKQQG